MILIWTILIQLIIHVSQNREKFRTNLVSLYCVPCPAGGPEADVGEHAGGIHLQVLLCLHHVWQTARQEGKHSPTTPHPCPLKCQYHEICFRG